MTTTPSCDTSSLLVRPSGAPALSSALHLDDAGGQSSITSATSVPQTFHHSVGIIVGTCLGVAGAILLVGLFLFWFFLRHRRPTETAEGQGVKSRSWARRDFLECYGVVVIANDQSRSIDLAGADNETLPVAPASETKQWNKSTEVLDISLENAPPSPPSPLPLPEPEGIEPSNPVPLLCIQTDVQADLSPPSSHSSITAGPSRSFIRPLPTPPMGHQAQVRRYRSATDEEPRRESGSGHRRPPHRKISTDDVRAYVHNSRQSSAHSKDSMCYEADDCGTLQHYNEGVDAWADFPPPYSES